MVTNCGCAAKLGPGTLKAALQDLPKTASKRLLVGYDDSDDAAAYLLDDGSVLLQTLDFFPPIVDDPYTFGQIAAANALSDIYAMGGRPITALNIVCFPQNEDMEILKEILRGGAEKVAEAGAVLAGGHSIDDKEPKYGLSVAGITDRAHLRSNACARVGDKLITTKALGTGIIVAAMKGEIAPRAAAEAAVQSMTTLNKTACAVMNRYDVSGVTDITGFSLGGHSCELAAASGTTAVLHAQAIPVLPDALRLAAMGIVPAGSWRNRRYFKDKTDNRAGAAWDDIIFDPQTSGGLLISVRPDQADALLAELRAHLTTPAAIIGEMRPRTGTLLVIE